MSRALAWIFSISVSAQPELLPGWLSSPARSKSGLFRPILKASIPAFPKLPQPLPMSWSTEFDDPIMLANGSVLFTLRDAANHVMGLPKKESALPHWQLAVECLLGAAERRRPVMMARIAMVKALMHGQAVEPPAPRRKAAKRYRIVS